MYVYIKSKRTLWTVGFYAPDGEWMPESDHASADAAAERVHWLNGGKTPSTLVGETVFVEAPDFEGNATVLSVQDDNTVRVQSDQNIIYTVLENFVTPVEIPW